MTIETFIEMTGEHPKDVLGNDWEAVVENLDDSNHIFFDDEALRFYYLTEDENGTPGEDGWDIITKKVYID